MLSPVEKREILQDARNTRRRNAFRQAQARDPLPSLDAYLEFLNGVHKTFSQTFPAPDPSRGHFKL